MLITRGNEGAQQQPAYDTFGSGRESGGALLWSGNFGESAFENLLRPRRAVSTFPGFCGGVGAMQDDDMEALFEHSGDQSPENSEDLQVQTSLDYVCRIYNYRNRCFANGPFRLWAWVGSFLQGPKLWTKTTAAVTAALGDNEVVNITTLETLTPLWQKFNERCKTMHHISCRNWSTCLNPTR